MRSGEHHPDPAFSTTIAHGFAILRCFSMAEPTLSNKELAERTGLSKATISRLTYTLTARGMLLYDRQLRRYRLGSAILALSYPLMANLSIRQKVRPLMRRLADSVGGSVSIGMQERLHMVYLETSRGHEAIGFRPDIGAQLPMLTTAMGRAWLAQTDEAENKRMLESWKEHDLNVWEQHASRCDHARERFRECGYCVSEGDWYADVHAVAVPLARLVDGDVLIFNCGVPASRLTKGQLERQIAPRLLRLVAQAEALLEETP